ncbi:MAG: hypothetical protein U0354_17790 [Candidatus Sericytochromatia bacterium]
MNIWNIEKLKNDIKSKNLSEKDKFYYMFINIILFTIVMDDSHYNTLKDFTVWDIISNTSGSIIEIIYIPCAFIANGANKGNDFLGKYFSISFVVSIRFLLLLIPIVFIYIIFDLFITGGSEDVKNEVLDADAYFSISFIIWEIFMYIRVCKHIRDLKDF